MPSEGSASFAVSTDGASLITNATYEWQFRYRQKCMGRRSGTVSPVRQLRSREQDETALRVSISFYRRDREYRFRTVPAGIVNPVADQPVVTALVCDDQ